MQQQAWFNLLNLCQSVFTSLTASLCLLRTYEANTSSADTGTVQRKNGRRRFPKSVTGTCNISFALLAPEGIKTKKKKGYFLLAITFCSNLIPTEIYLWTCLKTPVVAQLQRWVAFKFILAKQVKRDAEPRGSWATGCQCCPATAAEFPPPAFHFWKQKGGIACAP